MKKITATFLSLLLAYPVSLLTSRSAHAGGAQSSTEICAAIAAYDKRQFGELACSSSSASCASNKDCATCVATSIKDSQVRPYCASLNAKTTAMAGQQMSINVNYLPAAVCATACALSVFAVAKAAIDRACTGGALLGAATDLMQTLNTMDKMSSDVKGWMIGSTALSAATVASKKVAQEASKAIGKKVAESCVATAFLGLSIASKLAAKGKIANTLDSEKGIVQELSSNLDSQFNACVAKTKPPECRATFASGMGGGSSKYHFTDAERSAAVGSSFEAPLLEAIKIPSTGAAAIDVAAIARDIDSGASVFETLGKSSGMPASMIEELKKFEDRIKSGENLQFNGADKERLAAAAPGAGTSPAGPMGFGTDEIGFGVDTVTPGESAEEIGIDRTPAQAAATLDSGDIFHTGYPGTIFQIISKKLADSHGYVEKLEPVLPLNRALNGYKNESPKTK